MSAVPEMVAELDLSLRQQIMAELKVIERQFGGAIPPKEWLKFAKDPRTASHAIFEWNNELAAEAHRLDQARRYISVFVQTLPNFNKPVRVWVSLSSDRVTGAGYRPLLNVMSNEQWRTTLLNDALEELTRFELKYKTLKELAQIFAAIKKLKPRKK